MDQCSFNTALVNMQLFIDIVVLYRLLPNGVYCDKKAWNSNKTFDTQQLCFDPLICTG